MDLALQPATDLLRALRERKVGCLELLDHYLARVERFNGPLNAVVAIDADGARDRARQADAALGRGQAWGPLHGLPMTVKDSIEVAGMPTTGGAPKFAGHMPAAHADAVQRLTDAGAVVFGKTNLPLFAGDFQSYNEVYGVTNNPWDLARSPGGSSGGAAAAVAAGLSALELGSDIGGSIRNPAHHCGIYGHKPSYGIVPQRGHVPPPPGKLSQPDIAVFGPLGRSAADLALALDVLAGPAPGEAAAWRLELPPPRADSLSGFRVAAWFDDALGPIDSAVADCLTALAANLEKAGVKVDRSARPAFDAEQAFRDFQQLMIAVMSAGLPRKTMERFGEEVPGLDRQDMGYRAVFMRNATQSHRDWLAAKERQADLCAVWANFFTDFDVLLCPVWATAAIVHDHSPDMAARTVTVNGRPFPYLDQMFWPGIISVGRLPATAAPAGLTPGGLPVGVQVVGPYLGDRTALRFSELMAQAVGGYTPPPGYG